MIKCFWKHLIGSLIQRSLMSEGTTELLRNHTIHITGSTFAALDSVQEVE